MQAYRITYRIKKEDETEKGYTRFTCDNVAGVDARNLDSALRKIARREKVDIEEIELKSYSIIGYF